MSLEERLRQAGNAVEEQVAARIDTAKLLADLRRREGVATLRPVAVGVGASTGSIAAPDRMEEFARAVVGGDPVAVQQFERAVLRPVETQSNPTPQGKRSSDVNVTFAHELRRRLATLRTLSEALEMRDNSDEQVETLVLLLVQELRDLEELEAAMVSPAKREVRDEVDVLEVARSAAQTVALARHSEIAVQGSRHPLRVLSNPTMLRQALENLMDNAATCGTGRPVEVVVRVSMTRRLPGIEVLVADRGPRLGKTSSSMAHRAGQGVGLPLVRKFAQDSGGRLWCRDREGGGAVFGLWLPAVIRKLLEGQDTPVTPALPPRPVQDPSVELRVRTLSAHERKILELLVNGYSNRRIAEECYLSLNTVRTQVQNVLVKLGVRSRLEAVAFALEHQIAPVDDWAPSHSSTERPPGSA